MLDNYPDFLTVDDVAAILHVHRNTVYEQIKRGEVKAVKIGRRVYVPKKWLVEALTVA